jgi:amidase
VTAWTLRFDPAPAGAVPGPAGAPLRVAIKDAIDLAGAPTTAGCLAVARRAAPAEADAGCLAGIRAGIRASDAVIVGKTTLTELCLSPTGINTAFGTPVNPIAPDRIPGGSSSGSAVALAAGEADLALGTDTGGSVRIPAACCGVVGLKTTWGRVSTAGVWPLTPSLDTVGPMAADVAGVATGMRLLAPDWRGPVEPATTVGRLRIEGVDPAVEAAVDAALAAAGLTVHNVQLPGWAASFDAFSTLILAEFWQAQHRLVDADGVTAATNRALHRGSTVDAGTLATARTAQQAWRAEVVAALDRVPLLALPTLIGPPPRLAEVRGFDTTALTAPFNTAGVPALSLPVPMAGATLPASLQLVGPPGAEELLCATGLVVERALRSGSDFRQR